MSKLYILIHGERNNVIVACFKRKSIEEKYYDTLVFQKIISNLL